MNKYTVTLVSNECQLILNLFDEYNQGGERTKDEMCFHMFTYYPRMNDLYNCVTVIDQSAWQDMLNTNS